MIYIIIAYFSQLPILCGPPHTPAAMFCCISFLDILSEEWRSVCRILSPEIYTHLLLGVLHHRVLDWGHYAIFFDKNGYILFLFQRTLNYLLLPICWFSLVLVAISVQLCGYILIYEVIQSISGGNSKVILFIFILNRVTANILSCGMPSSWFLQLNMWYQHKLWTFY